MTLSIRTHDGQQCSECRSRRRTDAAREDRLLCLWREARAAAGSLHPLALASFPLVILIYVANGLRFFWFDYLYGFALGFLLPEMLLKRMV